MNDRDNHDTAIVTLMLEGDERAFDIFIDEYYPRLYRFAFKRMGNDAEATLEVVQGTFEKILPKLAVFRGEAALFTWMCSFCRFEIAAYWRKRAKIQPEVELNEDNPAVQAALESLAAAGDGPWETYERKELARLVRTALDHLPLSYGNALEWKYLKGKTVRQIAVRLGLSHKAAESLLGRARSAFRDGFSDLVGGWTS